MQLQRRHYNELLPQWLRLRGLHALSNRKVVLFLTLAALTTERGFLRLLLKRYSLLGDGDGMRADPVESTVVRPVLDIHHTDGLIDVFEEGCRVAVVLACAGSVRAEVRRVLLP